MEDRPRPGGRMVTLQGIEVAGQPYWAWTWDDGEAGFSKPEADEIRELRVALAELAAAVPRPPEGRGPSLVRRIERSSLYREGSAFYSRVEAARNSPDGGATLAELALVAACADGSLGSLDRERHLAAELGRLLLPDAFIARLRGEAAISRPTVQVLPTPETATVPWEILRTQSGDVGDERLADLADVVTMATLLPRDGEPSLPHPARDGGPALRVIDPAPRSQVSRVLMSDQVIQWRRRAQSEPSSIADGLTADELSELLRGSDIRPARLFYLGHVVASSDAPGRSSLVLSSGVGGVHHYSAFQLALAFPGHVPATAADWPVPPRVALIACASGTDFSQFEPYGLVTVYLEYGAELVTATRWTMLTDQALELMGADAAPFNELAIAVDDAHEAADPVRQLCEWQRGKLAAWRSGGAIADSPLTWAAVTTWVAPDRTERGVVPSVLS